MAAGAKRVVLLGGESTGKTTLARALAAAYGTVWNPEYGRAYTEVRERGRPWTTDEFTHIAQMQCWYEDQLAPCARSVLFCDTDAFTTALFHQVYLGIPTSSFDDLAGRGYDLYLLCGLDVPWSGDTIREFADQRRWMHQRFIEHCEQSSKPWRLLEGPHEQRLAGAQTAVDTLLQTP